jgi:hypothetical protein
LREECSALFLGKVSNPPAYNAILDELVRRKSTRELVDTFRRTLDRSQRYAVYEAMERIAGNEIERLFKSMADRNLNETSLLAVKHFAKRGDKWALRILNDNYFRYGGSSVEWAEVVELFGKYRYEPAVENLANSVGAASMNLGWAAHQSLEQIYPDANCYRSSPFETEACWVDYVKQRKKKKTS